MYSMSMINNKGHKLKFKGKISSYSINLCVGQITVYKNANPSMLKFSLEFNLFSWVFGFIGVCANPCICIYMHIRTNK